MTIQRIATPEGLKDLYGEKVLPIISLAYGARTDDRSRR
jgi:hypothetical protein